MEYSYLVFAFLVWNFKPHEVTSNTSPHQSSIAFNLSMTTGSHCYNKDDVVIFDRVIYDQGGGYDLSSGIYHISKSGVYDFILHICVHLGKHGDFIISRGNTVIKVIDVHGKHEHTTCSLIVVDDIQLNESQSILVKTALPSCLYSGINGESYLRGYTL